MPSQEITTATADQPIAAPRDASLSKGALRTRRYRERKAGLAKVQAAGGFRVKFDLTPDGIDLLVGLGWIAAADRQNCEAVEAGFAELVNQAATVGLRPGQVSL